MRWPWARAVAKHRLIVSWSANTLCYVQAAPTAAGFQIKAMGMEAVQAAPETPEADVLTALEKRLEALALDSQPATVMLRPEQSLWLQIPAPNVPQEELRAAARFQIRDMVDMHLDDLTIDVLRVGAGLDKAAGQMFVVVGRNTEIRAALALAQTMHWSVHVVDVQEMAQRNLHTAWAASQRLAERATASLMVGQGMALLTICVKDELYLSRRLETPEGLLEMDWSQSVVQTPSDEPDGYTPVSEYVPSYATPLGGMEGGMAPSEDDRAQRWVQEIQRSLDLWERTWTQLPLTTMAVFAGTRSQDMATWLGQALGHNVVSMGLETRFAGLAQAPQAQQLACAPLLGLLLRPQGGEA